MDGEKGLMLASLSFSVVLESHSSQLAGKENRLGGQVSIR